MKKLTLIGKILITITLFGVVMIGCNNQNQTKQDTFENPNGGKLNLIIDYHETSRGVSLITLSTGERFIYCETPEGVSVCQIFDTYNHKDAPFIPLDTNTSIY